MSHKSNKTIPHLGKQRAYDAVQREDASEARPQCAAQTSQRHAACCASVSGRAGERPGEGTGLGHQPHSAGTEGTDDGWLVKTWKKRDILSI